jgi:hypothetical protein
MEPRQGFALPEMAEGCAGMLLTEMASAGEAAEVPQALDAVTVMFPPVAVAEKLAVVELPEPAKVAPVPL